SVQGARGRRCNRSFRRLERSAILSTMSVALLPDEPIRRLTVKEYNQLADLGAFADERVELLDGVVYRISPPNAPHATVSVKLNRIFARHLADEIELRVQLPIETDRYSE